MVYRIARNGEVFATYSLLQFRRELASGTVVATDLVQAEGSEEWLPVSELFPQLPMQDEAAPSASGAPRLYPDPPDLQWWIALVLGVVTLGAFFVLWDVVQAVWLRRVERTSVALVLYGIAAGLYLINLPSQLASINHALLDGPLVDAPYALWLSMGALLMRLAARFVMRRDLLRHFQQAEHVDLRLHWLLTLCFGGLYFQYEFNQVNRTKRAMHVSVPPAA